MWLRRQKFRSGSRILLGLVLVTAIVAALFDWNWFRQPVEHYFSERSQREVRIGELDVDIGLALAPTVHLRGLYIENAPWAGSRPFITAGEVSLTFALKGVWEGRPVISRLVLIDADVDMQRQADGLRNWRLRSPDDRGPGRAKILRLEAHNSRISFVRRDLDLEVVFASSPIGNASENSGGALTTRILFEGVIRGVPFSGDLLCGERLTFLDTGEQFRLQGQARSGETRLDVDGSVADLIRPSVLDGKIRLAGPSLGELQPLLRATLSEARLPETRAYQAEAQIHHAGNDITASSVKARIGGTDLAGKGSYHRNGKRPLLRAELRSESADLDDLGPLLGFGRASGLAAAATASPRAAPDQAEKKPESAARIFPDGKIRFEKLGVLDAQVSVDAKKLKAENFPGLESLRFSAALENGILKVQPIHLGLAGGRMEGWLTLDGRKRPAFLQVNLEFLGVHLDRLVDLPFFAGPLAARVDLRGRGSSVATLLGAASGTLALGMEGGRISNLMDAKLGLNFGKILRLMIGGDKSIAINSAEAIFDFDEGAGTLRDSFLDTEQTRVVGTGSINLRDETLGLVLTPHPKKPGMFSLRDSTINIDGSFAQPQVAVVKSASKPRSRG